MALTLYKSLVLLHLDYCDTSESLNKLKLEQNVACRILLLAKKKTGIDLMHSELNLLKLNTRRQIHLGNFSRKKVHLEMPSGVSNFFNRRANAATRISRRVDQYNVFVLDVHGQNGWKTKYKNSEISLFYRPVGETQINERNLELAVRSTCMKSTGTTMIAYRCQHIGSESVQGQFDFCLCWPDVRYGT